MRVLLLIPAVILLLMASAKLYATIKRPQFAPEFIADATVFTLIAVVLIWLFRRVGRKPDN